ncbi:MAG: conjugal transfer protein TraG N-terminal domain-containing protein [Usitatibacteraceae bacterium]
MVALIGVLVALFTGLFNPAKFTGWGWFAGFVALYFFMFVPKVNVQLIDKLNGSPPVVVGNVPIGLAAFGHFTSKVGDWATRSYETVMQPLGLPDPLKYQNNGLLFGNKVISASRQVAIASPQLKTDLVNFVYNCTMYDLADNSINPNAFATSLDIWALMGTTNPARFTTFGTAPSTIGSCQTAYTYLNNQLPAEINRARSMLALEMNPLRNPASVTTALIDDQVQQSHFRYRIATGAQTATDLLRQNAMINIMRDSANVIGQKMNDPATVMLANAQAQAVASTNANFVSQGKLAEQALPMLRNVIEAIIYAVFPIMFIFFLTLQGPALIAAIKSFFLALIWVQLWPPLYAVLNYMGTMSSARTLEAAANFGGGAGLTLDTANSIYSGAISDQAVIGYMAISIPLFASALVFGMNKLGSLGAATFLGAATRATEAAGSGNISMGNQTMDQSKIDPGMTDPSMRTDSNAFGASTSQITPSGSSLVAYKSNLSNLSTAIDITSKDAESMGETAKATQAIATQQSQTAAESSVASALQAISIIDKRSKSGEQSGGSNSMATGGQSSAVNFVNDTAREIQNVLGKNVSAEAAQKMAAAIGVTAAAYARGEGWVKGAAGGKNPLFTAETGAQGSIGMQVGADGSLRFENSNLSKETLSALDQVAKKARESKQLSEGMSYIKNFSPRRRAK